jgi:hypothetical protein
MKWVAAIATSVTIDLSGKVALVTGGALVRDSPGVLTAVVTGRHDDRLGTCGRTRADVGPSGMRRLRPTHRKLNYLPILEPSRVGF